MEQIELTSYMMPRFKINKPIRLIELFAGIGAQAKALERLGVEFEHWRAIEWDKYAMASYNAIHGTNFETSDIQKIHAADLGIEDRDKYCYIMTYSFPCQDISGAGYGKGLDKGSGTRSGLLWEVERILDECGDNLPQVLLMENVPLLIGKKHIANFQKWRSKLEQLSYSNYVQLLNSKDHGIPQNRNRCFMVSVLGDYYYSFPEKRKLKLRLKDMLEENVDEKYYLTEKAISRMINTNYLSSSVERRLQESDGISNTLCARDYKDPLAVIDVGHIEKGTGKHQSNQVYSMDGLCPTLSVSTGIKEPAKMFIDGLPIRNNNSKGYELARPGDGIDISSRMHHHRGTVQKGMAQTLDTQCNVGVIGNYMPSNHSASSIVDTNGIAPTVMENHGTVTTICEEDEREEIPLGHCRE